MRFFVYHGKEDGVIEYAKAMKTYELFVAQGFKQVEIYSEEFLEHGVSPTETKKIKEFLSKVMQ